MIENARFVHTNLIARDWRALAAFYQSVFGCAPVPPEREYSGPAFDAGTGVLGAILRGVHLRLPGYGIPGGDPGGDAGPTLEIFNYTPLAAGQPGPPNRPGFGHIAFAVQSVEDARAEVLAAGGQPVGDVVTLVAAAGRRVTWCYVRDPEGNIVELQAWSSQSSNP